MSLERLLVVSHEATLTGAPMNLLHFATWLRRSTSVEVHALLMQDGPLAHRFDEVVETTVLDRGPAGALLGAAQQGLVALGSRRAWKPVAASRLRPQLRHLEDFDVVYLNSATSVGVLPYLPPARHVVSHVHELGVALQGWRPPELAEVFRTAPELYIAASDAVHEALVDVVGVEAARIRVHHEFIDTRPFVDHTVSARDVEALRRSVRIPREAAVVMGAGTIDWRKGPDLFVQLAAEVRRRTRDEIHFVWVGGDLSGLDMRRLQSDIDRAGADHVHFVGVKPDPRRWFALADVFALTSREDPFPLVCLEHAALGHPIVTYRNGGIPELLEAAGPDAAAGIVDHLDVGALADAVIAYTSSERRAAIAGDQLRRRVLDRHDVRFAAPRLLADLSELAGGPPRIRPESVAGGDR